MLPNAQKPLSWEKDHENRPLHCWSFSCFSSLVYWLKLSLAEPLLAMLVRWTASEAAFPSAAILPDRARRVAEKKTVTGNSYQAGRLQTGWEYCWKPAGERVCGGGRGIKPTSLSTASHLRRKSFSDKTQRSPAPQRNKQTNKQTNKSQRSPAPQRPQVGDRVQQFAGLASTPDMDPTNRSQTRDLCTYDFGHCGHCAGRHEMRVCRDHIWEDLI